MQWGLDIKNRKWKHKNYMMTFLGNEAVDWLMKTLGFNERAQAVTLAQILLDRCIFRSVTFSEVFMDKPIPYKFYRYDKKKYEVTTSAVVKSAYEKANRALTELMVAS